MTIERIDYSQYASLSEDQLISHQVARRIEYHNHPRNMLLSNCGIMLTYEGKDRKRVKGMVGYHLHAIDDSAHELSVDYCFEIETVAETTLSERIASLMGSKSELLRLKSSPLKRDWMQSR